MKITDARVIVCCPGRNFVTLKIETDEGLTGIGNATLNGRELAVAPCLTEHVIPRLIGRDAHQIEDIWQYLYKGAYWRRGPVTMSAIAAVDTALWDIKAKAANPPLHRLLGGKSRNGVVVYGHANGRHIEQTVDEVLRYKEEGYLAIRAQSGVPGLEKVYGVGRGTMFYEPADADLPSEHDWSTTKYLNHTPQLPQRLLDTVRDLLAAHTSIERLALAVAAWFHYLRGVDEAGTCYAIHDPLSAELAARLAHAQAAGSVYDSVAHCIGFAPVFGDLGVSKRFIGDVARHAVSLQQRGVVATLAELP